MTFSASTHLLMCLSLETLISIIRTDSPILVELVGGLDLWHLFISFDTSICSTMTFPPLGYSDHAVVSVSTDFPSCSQSDALFHCISFGYSCADWDSHCDNLRDVPWEDIFKLSTFATASEIF